jgi:S-adenosylmethionine-diacylgycerolhomoserine-N-methlytransferase
MIGSMRGDMAVLLQMLRGRSSHGTHQQQLEAFYSAQAGNYDAFRARLLHGRKDLIEQLEILPGHSVAELGAGTGQNLQYLEYPLSSYRDIYLVDLCPSLLEVARQRYRGIPNIRIIETDVTRFYPQQLLDRVYFSYALTMIPDWKAAIDSAINMLKPGGLIGVVDFFVSGSEPDALMMQHGYLERRFWRSWFAHDGVNLTPEHLHYLRKLTDMVSLEQSRGAIPYLPFIKAPYYIYVGQKR